MPYLSNGRMYFVLLPHQVRLYIHNTIFGQTYFYTDLDNSNVELKVTVDILKL